jgi:hypothetical protein
MRVCQMLLELIRMLDSFEPCVHSFNQLFCVCYLDCRYILVISFIRIKPPQIIVIVNVKTHLLERREFGCHIHYYVCRGRIKESHLDGSPRCTIRSIEAEELEKAVWS